MSFLQVLNLAFAEGHSIEILLTHISYQTGSANLRSGGWGTWGAIPCCCPSLVFSFFFFLWICPRCILRNRICQYVILPSSQRVWERSKGISISLSIQRSVRVSEGQKQTGGRGQPELYVIQQGQRKSHTSEALPARHDAGEQPR